jgi:molybdopterin molybdotransferase
MHTVEAARARICASVLPLGHEPVALGAASGRTLAAGVRASRDQPPFRSSAMDGYAARAVDLDRALTVIGQSAAGNAYPGRIGRGEAVRIFTGAPVPDGADWVVAQEKTRRDAAGLFIASSSKGSANIRAVAADFRAGAELVAAGTRLTSRHVALIAAAGVASVPVSRRPIVALLATGTEIRSPGEPAGPHQIYDSVTFGLDAMIDEWGGCPLRFGSVPDEDEAMSAAVLAALRDADGLVIAGGASVGEYDVVKRALSTLGLEISIRQIAVRPGKPTWFGTLHSKPVLGLPGNPAAAFVCAHLLLRPLLHTLLRRTAPAPSDCVAAALDGTVGANGGNESYLRAAAWVGADAHMTVRPFADQDTSLVSVFAAANALIRRPPGAPPAAAGDIVETLLLDRA